MNIDFTAMAANVEKAEKLLKILANKNRLMILCSLQDTEMNVSQLNEAVPLAQSALSQHLAALRKANNPHSTDNTKIIIGTRPLKLLFTALSIAFIVLFLTKQPI